MVRAHIRLNTTIEATQFVSDLNTDGTSTKYTIENYTGGYKVNARSLLGVIYMMSEYNDTCFFVNETEDGVFPSSIDKYRVL